MDKRNLAIALGIASTVLCSQAHAAPTTFFGVDLNGPPRQDPNALASHPNADTARTNFLANLVGVGTETFESFVAGTAPPLALVFPGAGTATLTGGNSVNSGNDNFGRYPISGNNYYEAGTSNFGITFSSPIAAFGFYGVDIGDYGGDLVLSLTDTASNVSTLMVMDPLSSSGEHSGSIIYFGFYDTAKEYTRIDFTRTTGGGDVFAFDDMTIGAPEQVKPVPEPATMTLMGLGLAGLGAAKRRRKA